VFEGPLRGEGKGIGKGKEGKRRKDLENNAFAPEISFCSRPWQKANWWVEVDVVSVRRAMLWYSWRVSHRMDCFHWAPWLAARKASKPVCV